MRRLRRFERLFVELAAEVDPQLAAALHVVWARCLPDSYALALPFSTADRWVLVCEARWWAEPEQRADTAAHEIAHLLSGDYGHGPKFRRAFRRLLRISREMEWT